jgi:hypothetical protein
VIFATVRNGDNSCDHSFVRSFTGISFRSLQSCICNSNVRSLSYFFDNSFSVRPFCAV